MTEPITRELEIVSNIQNGYNESDDPVVFIYNVKMKESNDIEIFSKIVTTTIGSNAMGKTTVTDMPPGYDVTVELIYCSAGFENIGENNRTITIEANSKKTVEYNYTKSSKETKFGAISTTNLWTDYFGNYECEINNDIHNQEFAIVADFTSWTLRTSIEASADNDPYYIRVKAFSNNSFTITDPQGDGTWYDGNDGYWYYRESLNGGETTTQINIKINMSDEDIEKGKDIDLYVIAECTPVRYNNGNAYNDWTK